MRSAWQSTRRVWFLVNVVVTAALLPALFTEPARPADPVAVRAGATPEARPVAATSAGDGRAVVLLDDPPTTTTAAPAPPAPPTTARPAPTTTTARPHVHVHAAAPKPAPAPTTTTTAAPKPKPKPAPTTSTTAAPAPSASRTQSGKASWYDHRPGICAHKTLPMGTIVTVTASNGRSTRCTVGDRGPYVEGWVIDLHPQEFEQLAPRSTGVISVTLSW